MEIMDLMVIIKWFFVWAGVTFVLGGVLMLYLKNAEYAAKAAEKKAQEEKRKNNNDVLLDLYEIKTEKTDTTEMKREGDDDENSGNKSQDSGD